MSVAAEKPVSEDDWLERATASAIAAARQVTSSDINQRASVGSLSDIEWGWIVTAVIFGWIKVRAEQAVAEGISPELTIRSLPTRDPEPWEAGALHSILPQLGGLEGVAWEKPVGEWSKDQITSFAWQIYKLSDQALARRDEGALASGIVQFDPERAERLNSEANGGPLMSRREFSGGPLLV